MILHFIFMKFFDSKLLSREKEWKCGFVLKTLMESVDVEMTNSVIEITKDPRTQITFRKSQISSCEMVPMMKRFAFEEDWEDMAFTPTQYDFNSEREVRDHDRLKSLTPSELFFECFSDSETSLWKRLLDGTNKSGTAMKEAKPNGIYRYWKKVEIDDLKELIRLKLAADLQNSPYKEFFSKGWSGQGSPGRIAENNPYYKFMLELSTN